MEFGVFDHLDKNERPLARYYAERLELIAAYERAGFYAYHVADQMRATGANYFVGQLAFGDLTQEETLRSIALFSREVMPRLRH
jgi:hypothetical protein